MKQSTTIIASYKTHNHAEQVIRDMHQAGFPMEQLSIIGKGYHSEDQPMGFYTMGDRMKSWGGFGAFWGSLWGFLVGSAFFWIPGIGLVGAAGPVVHLIVVTLEGAVIGGGVSALGAALVSLGVPEDRVIKYEKHLRANRFVVIARGDEETVALAKKVFARTESGELESYEASVQGQQLRV
jgi:uncharacterized membrane protein